MDKKLWKVIESENNILDITSTRYHCTTRIVESMDICRGVLRKMAMVFTEMLKSFYFILEVGLPLSKFQVDPTKKWTSNLDSPLKVIPKYRILVQ